MIYHLQNYRKIHNYVSCEFFLTNIIIAYGDTGTSLIQEKGRKVIVF